MPRLEKIDLLKKSLKGKLMSLVNKNLLVNLKEIKPEVTAFLSQDIQP